MCSLKKAREIPWFNKMVATAIEENDGEVEMVKILFKKIYKEHRDAFADFDVDDLFETVCRGMLQDGIKNEDFYAGKVAECCISGIIHRIDETTINKFAKRLRRGSNDMGSVIKAWKRCEARWNEISPLLPKKAAVK